MNKKLLKWIMFFYVVTIERENIPRMLDIIGKISYSQSVLERPIHYVIYFFLNSPFFFFQFIVSIINQNNTGTTIHE